jgi:hypothetical protein
MHSRLIVPAAIDSLLDRDKPHSEEKRFRSAFFFKARRACCIDGSMNRKKANHVACRQSIQKVLTKSVPGGFRVCRAYNEKGDAIASPPNRVKAHRALSARSTGRLGAARNP